MRIVELHQKAFRHKEALRFLEKAAALQPENGELLVRLGQLHSILGDYSQVVSCYEQALALDPKNRALREELVRTRRVLERITTYRRQYEEGKGEYWDLVPIAKRIDSKIVGWLDEERKGN